MSLIDKFVRVVTQTTRTLSSQPGHGGELAQREAAGLLVPLRFQISERSKERNALRKERGYEKTDRTKKAEGQQRTLTGGGISYLPRHLK